MRVSHCGRHSGQALQHQQGFVILARFFMAQLLRSESGVRWRGYFTMTLPVILGWREQ